MRGRGHEKIEQDGVQRKMSIDVHGQPLLRLPKVLIKMGLKLDQDVKIVVERNSSDPLNWELRIRPARACKAR